MLACRSEAASRIKASAHPGEHRTRAQAGQPSRAKLKQIRGGKFEAHNWGEFNARSQCPPNGRECADLIPVLGGLGGLQQFVVRTYLPAEVIAENRRNMDADVCSI